MDPARPFLPLDSAQIAFVGAVEARMDEVTPDGETPRVQAAKIYGFALEACDAVLGAVPLGSLGALAVTAGGVTDVFVSHGQTRGVRINLGADVLRVVSVRLAGWLFPVFEADVRVPEDAASVYSLELNPHRVRPLSRPAVYRTADATGEALDCFPATGAAAGDGPSSVHTALVLRRLRPEALLDVRPDLAALVAWDAAARTLTAERFADAATVARSMVTLS